MKPSIRSFVFFLSLLALAFGATSARAQKDFDPPYRFIFYAVLEGCYEDGLGTNDVAQILLRNKTNYYYTHFVYACPVCTPAIHALEAYQSRPPHLYGMKTKLTTFGPGLSPELKKKLYSETPEDRLAAINTLVQGWVSKRMALLRLSTRERADLQKTLEEMRKKGMEYLKRYEKQEGGTFPVTAFKNVHQCAVCNGVCGKPLPADEK